MIRIEHLTRRFGDVAAVDDVSLTVPGGTITALVGTSGSGKTTLLRMVNRLVEPDAGRIIVGATDVASVAPHLLRRRIGYAIQGDGLFPHRSVARNIATVPRLLGWEAARIRARVDELLELFQMEPAQFRDRMPHELSGGQRQRVGVARALAAEPELLLMDEPFGALDPVLRARAQADLRAIQRRLGTTVLIVTHDLDEAILLADRIAVMQAGRIVQEDSPAAILSRPAHPLVEALVETADRPFRLLALSPVADLREPGDCPGPAVPAEASLRDALALCLWHGLDRIAVEGGGHVTMAALRARARCPAARGQPPAAPAGNDPA